MADNTVTGAVTSSLRPQARPTAVSGIGAKTPAKQEEKAEMSFKDWAASLFPIFGGKDPNEKPASVNTHNVKISVYKDMEDEARRSAELLRQDRQGLGITQSLTGQEWAQRYSGEKGVTPSVVEPQREYRAEIKPAPTSSTSTGLMARSDINSATPSAVATSIRPQARPDTLVAADTSTELAIYAPRGAAYAQDQVKSYSYYNEPLVEGGLRGNSRRGGDASRDVQQAAIDAIVSAGKAAGMTPHQIALTLAIARHESGFNPDAAAGTTTAHGLGQFIKDTGKAYGLNDTNRWDLTAQAEALVAHTLDNIKIANRRGKGDEYVYKYHHDGPRKDYGGLTLAREFVMPYISLYENMLSAE
jgi:hypothetical protein